MCNLQPPAQPAPAVQHTARSYQPPSASQPAAAAFSSSSSSALASCSLYSRLQLQQQQQLALQQQRSQLAWQQPACEVMRYDTDMMTCWWPTVFDDTIRDIRYRLRCNAPDDILLWWYHWYLFLFWCHDTRHCAIDDTALMILILWYRYLMITIDK